MRNSRQVDHRIETLTVDIENDPITKFNLAPINNPTISGRLLSSKKTVLLCLMRDRIVSDSPPQQNRSFDCFSIYIEKQNSVQPFLHSSNWRSLFNSTAPSHAVSLDGYLVTDRKTGLYRWPVPVRELNTSPVESAISTNSTTLFSWMPATVPRHPVLLLLRNPS